MSDRNEEAWRAAAELERLGDAAAAAEGPAEGHYREAQKVLLPTGFQWSDAAEYDRRLGAFNRIQQKIWGLKTLPPMPPPPARPTAAYTKFKDSTNITYERWHDGIGYDLDALARSSEPERAAVADDLIRRLEQGEGDWRDVEALAALNPPRARAALEKGLRARGLSCACISCVPSKGWEYQSRSTASSPTSCAAARTRTGFRWRSISRRTMQHRIFARFCWPARVTVIAMCAAMPRR
jgi:hypothetical protein